VARAGAAHHSDIAVYPYVALVPEGQVDLAPWPALVRWLGRVQALPEAGSTQTSARPPICWQPGRGTSKIA
jgi:glutathione S-transferase